MQTAKKLAALGALILGLYVLSASGFYDALSARLLGALGDRRMKNVVVTDGLLPAAAVSETLIPDFVSRPAPSRAPAVSPPPVPSAVPSADIFGEIDPSGEGFVRPSRSDEEIMETTIRGGLTIKNETSYWVDAAQMVSDGPGLTLAADAPQILIIHTHSSEAYTQAGLDRYQPSDSYRTENTEFNIVRIGDELTDILQQAGLNVIHDRGIYDYPSYTGSYTRSAEAVSRYLSDYPSINVVIDMHRDALGSDGVVYKTMAEEDGSVASQIMLLVGTDESGLEHPNWRGNLAFALYLQDAVNSVNPTLMRPVDLVRERYNQHLSPASLIMEVGSSGNTLQEALAAIRLFGAAAAPALAELVQSPADAEAPAE